MFKRRLPAHRNLFVAQKRRTDTVHSNGIATKKKAVNTILSGMPFIIGGLYLLGYSYHVGYLEGLGIPPSLFPQEVHRLIFKGVMAFVTLSLAPLFYSVLSLTIAVLAASLATTLLSKTKLDLAHEHLIKFINSSRSEQRSHKIISFIEPAAKTAIYIFAALVFVLLMVFAIIAAEYSGKNEAETFRASAIKSDNNYVSVTIVGSGDVLYIKPIICNEKYCAYLDKNRSLIISTEKIDRYLLYPYNNNTDAK